MKRLKKIFLVCLILALLTSTALPAYAESQSGKDGWTVTYDGKSISSNFKTNISDTIKGMQPGDDVTFTITLKNTGNKLSIWYMSNDVLKSLEDSTEISGGVYGYTLTYSGGSGSRVIFDSSSVGVEEDSELGKGLHQATSALKEFFYLDKLKAGATATITLKVSLDGETQGNAYADKVGQIEMNFMAELDSKVSGGDSNELLPLFIAMLVSGGGLVCLGIVYLGRRKKREVEA